MQFRSPPNATKYEASFVEARFSAGWKGRDTALAFFSEFVVVLILRPTVAVSQEASSTYEA
jgi:hypothetical protein